MYVNKIDQTIEYGNNNGNRRHNMEIQGIPSSVSDEDLEKKVVDNF